MREMKLQQAFCMFVDNKFEGNVTNCFHNKEDVKITIKRTR